MLNDHSFSMEAIKAAPPVSLATVQYVFGFALPDVVNLLTAVWLLCLIVPRLWRLAVWVHDKLAAA